MDDSLGQGLGQLGSGIKAKAEGEGWDLLGRGLDEKDREALREHLPSESSCFMTVGGHALHYFDQGPKKGTALLALHGNPSWSVFYRSLLPLCRQGYRVIIPDHIGCGLSSKPLPEEYNYTLGQRVADLESFIETLQLESFYLIAHDWGGLIALSYMLAPRADQKQKGHFSEGFLRKVRGLVLMNTSGFGLPPGRPLHWTLKLCQGSFWGRFLLKDLGLFTKVANAKASSRGLSPSLQRLYTLPFRRKKDRDPVLAFVQDIPLYPEHVSWAQMNAVRQRLSQLGQLPVMILWGGKDFIFDRAFFEHWQRLLPAARFHYFAEASHYVLEDVPEKAVALIHSFIAGTEAQRQDTAYVQKEH